jgi:CDP-diacylglycerol--glycerol-3-phosphate 3-phosphatidyltransferase
MGLPNYLTCFRIILIPIFVLVFYLPFSFAHKAAAGVFLLAAITDWLDGYLARSLQQTSKFGAFLDPVADKLTVSIALVLLVGERSIPYLAIPAAIIVGREIVISALREWMAELGKRTSIAVSFVGKAKTLIQMAALFLLIAFRPSESWIGVIGCIMIYVAACLTLWSMFVYLRLAWPELIKE